MVRLGQGGLLRRPDVERASDATVAIPDRAAGALPVFTHIAAGHARVAEVLERDPALRAGRMPFCPLEHEGLTADKDRALRPRTKLTGSDHLTDRVRRNVTERHAVIADLGDLELSVRPVASNREDDTRGTTDVSGDGGVKWLQRHVIEVHCGRASS